MNRLNHIIDVGGTEARKDTNPQSIIHHEIRAFQITDLTATDILVRGLPHQVPGKDEPRSNSLVFQIPDQPIPGEWGRLTNCKREPEPTGYAVGRRFRQDKEFFQMVEPLPQGLPV